MMILFITLNIIMREVHWVGNPMAPKQGNACNIKAKVVVLRQHASVSVMTYAMKPYKLVECNSTKLHLNIPKQSKTHK